MTHHNRRAYPPRKREPENPIIAAMRAAGERLEEQMRNPQPPCIWLTRQQYDYYLTLINGEPDPSIRVIEPGTSE